MKDFKSLKNVRLAVAASRQSAAFLLENELSGFLPKAATLT
jgi:hypothetical protein